MGAFRDPLLLTAIALFIGTLANWLLRGNYKPHAANLWLVAATFAFLLAAHIGLQIFSPVLTSRQLADAIAPELHPDDIIVIHGEYESASTLGFYLRRPDSNTQPMHILNGRSSNLWYGSFFPDAPPIFEDNVSLSLKWTGPAASSSGRISTTPSPASSAKPTSSPRAAAKRSSATSPTPTRRHQVRKEKGEPQQALPSIIDSLLFVRSIRLPHV